MSLDRPSLKMSKSHPNPKSRILLTDTRDEISKKLRVALTDSIDGVSYDPIARPGVSNLLDIAFHMSTHQTDEVEAFAKDYEGVSLRALKESVAEAVDRELAPIRDRFESIMGSGSRDLDDAAAIGAAKASHTAKATMTLVREAVGLSQKVVSAFE